MNSLQGFLLLEYGIDLVCSCFTIGERHKIIEAAISVVLSRDMSLNRRLFSIITSYDDDVIAVLKAMFTREYPLTDLVNLQKPYKIMISLLDRANDGDKLLDSVLVTLLSSLRKKCRQSNQTSDSLIPVANTLLSSIHPYLFWKNMHFCMIDLLNGDFGINEWKDVRITDSI